MVSANSVAKLCIVGLLLFLIVPGVQADTADDFNFTNWLQTYSYAYDWYKDGYELYNNGNYEQAITCYDKALEIDPDYAFAWNNKGAALYYLGRYDEAITCYDKALEIDPGFEPAITNRNIALNKLKEEWYNYGVAYYEVGRYEEAIVGFDRALEIDPDDADAVTMRAAAENASIRQTILTICLLFALPLAVLLYVIRLIKVKPDKLKKQELSEGTGIWMGSGVLFSLNFILPVLGPFIAGMVCAKYSGAGNYRRFASPYSILIFGWIASVVYVVILFLLTGAGLFTFIIPTTIENITALNLVTGVPAVIAGGWYINRNADESETPQHPAVLESENVLHLWKKLQAAIEDAKQYIAVPDTAMKLLREPDPDPDKIRTALSDLEKLLERAEPNFNITFDYTRLNANEWHKTEILVENTGDAHAFDVMLTFSDEFDTKRLTPIDIPAGTSQIIDIGIKPRVKGTVPFEVTATYRDKKENDYKQTFEFWIDVLESSQSHPMDTPGPATAQSPLTPSSPTSSTPKTIPEELSDSYQEWEYIGKGGFAKVFKAKRGDGKYVAVKVPLSLDAATGKTFITEMQNWTDLVHTNIVKIYDFNILPIPHFEMELCDQSLADLQKPVEPNELCWILFNICEGLKYSHARNIIHRDLKPQNILLKDGVPKITDWGLSKVLAESRTMSRTEFTLYYAAPEQMSSKQKDQRTDIWQLGVIMYELATGKLPFRGDSVVETLTNISTKEPEKPGQINPEAEHIEPVILKCLQKDPDRRYQSVAELQKDLAEYLKINYTESLRVSISRNDFSRSAYYCGELLLVNLHMGDLVSAHKYVTDLAHYAKGDIKKSAKELSGQIRVRLDLNVRDVPEELIKKAEVIAHKVRVGFGK